MLIDKTHTITSDEWKNAVQNATILPPNSDAICALQAQAHWDIQNAHLIRLEAEDDADWSGELFLEFDDVPLDEFCLNDSDWGTMRYIGAGAMAYGDLFPEVKCDALWHILHYIYWADYNCDTALVALTADLEAKGLLERANQAVETGELRRTEYDGKVSYHFGSIKPSRYPDPDYDYMCSLAGV